MKKLKEGEYYINIANSSLRSVNNDEDFSKFSYLGIRINGDAIRLINSPIRGFIFVCGPSVDGRYIRLNEILKIKEEEKMDKEKIKVTSAEIIVTCKPEKNPYYEIKYLEVGKNEYTIGYGSYDLGLVTHWRNNCFEIVTDELKPAERIRQLEKEKAALELQIEKQTKYDKIRKAGDDLALAVKALQDSGFSRNEAMRIFMMTGMNAMILPFLGR